MTRYLIDTNVISQFVKASPSASVSSWLSSTPDEDVALSVVAHLRGRGVPLLDPFSSLAEIIAPAT